MTASPAFSTDAHSHAEIQAAVRQFVVEAAGAGVDLQASVGKLDPRLKLARCNEPLRVFWPAGARKQGNASVGVGCDGPRPWKIYVPVSVAEFREIVVARVAIQKGKAISPEDLVLERREVSRLGAQPVDRVAPLIGQKARINIKPGTPVTLTMLELPKMVSRGETVTILASAGGIEVRMTGEALADGLSGGTVKVRNLSSNRVVEGEVVGKGLVQVRF